jgi:hypothetical protein
VKLWSNDFIETKKRIVASFFHPKFFGKKLGKISSSSANLTNFAIKENLGEKCTRFWM